MSIWSGIKSVADKAYSLISSPFGSSSSLDWSKLGMGALGIGAQLGSDILGGAFSYSTNKKLQKQSYKYARRLQQFQFDWQERMARNAHTYEVEDLRNAGLNPILSATGGNGAAVPSGSSGTPVSAPGGNAFSGFGSKIDILSTILQLKRLESDIKVNDSIAYKNRAEGFEAGSRTLLHYSDIEVNISRISNTRADTVNKKLAHKSFHARADIDHYKAMGAKDDWYALNQRVNFPINIAIGDELFTFNNITMRDALVLQRFAKAQNEDMVSIAVIRKILAEIKNINANTDLTNAERSAMFHKVIQGYIKNVTDGIFAYKGSGGVIRSRQYDKK